MWGNMTGWIISLVFVAAVLAGYNFITPKLTGATELSTGENLEVLVLPVPETIVDQSAEGDAGQTYRAAAAAYNEGSAITFMKNPAGTVPSAIAMVLEATHKSKASIFSNTPSDLLNYDNGHEDLSNLKNLGNYVVKAGMTLKNKGNAAEAKKYFEAGYALGWNLCKERLTHDEYMVGLEVMEYGLQELGEIAPAGSEQKAQEEKCLKDLKTFDVERIKPIYQALSSINLKDEDFHAGDVFRFATQAKDRMIRDEAILGLGSMRFFASKTSDQEAVPKCLDKLEQNLDPYISTAAKAARELTEAKYNSQSHMPP